MTDDVAELAERMIENYVAETLNNFDKELNKIFKNNKNIKLKPGKKVKKKQEFPIGRKIGDFVIIKYRCCDEETKILNIRKFVGGYCPFCGGLTDGNPETVLQPEDFAEWVRDILKMNRRAMIANASIFSTNP